MNPFQSQAIQEDSLVVHMQASQYSGNGSSSRQKRQSSSLGRSIGYKRSRTQCNDDRVWSNQYDPDTNQCYREATCSAQPAGNPVSAWLRQKNQHPSGSVPTSSTVIGARSLRKMCLHTIANHTDQFDNIDGLDWRFGKDIWQFLFHRFVNHPSHFVTCLKLTYFKMSCNSQDMGYVRQ